LSTSKAGAQTAHVTDNGRLERVGSKFVPVRVSVFRSRSRGRNIETMFGEQFFRRDDYLCYD